MRPRQIIESALSGLLVLSIGSGISSTSAQNVPEMETLTNAAQVRQLTFSELSQARPARLRGVVIADQPDPHERSVIIADATAGIYLLAGTNLFAGIDRGDLLEVIGVTDPGEFAPIVRAQSVRKLGNAAIPAPRPVTYQELISGAMDAQWVEMRGVIRRCLNPSPPGCNFWRLVVAMNGGTVSVRIPLPEDPHAQVDAEVRICGICLYEFNKRRQVLTPVVQMQVGVPIQFENNAPTNPFAATVHAADSLLLFTPENAVGHRIHVHGIVTYAKSGSFVWIRDSSSGLRIQSDQPHDLQPGDEIDALGFPAYGQLSPVLEDSVFQKIGHGPPPQPLLLTNFNQTFDHEDDLIVTEAKVSAIQPILGGAALTLDLNGTFFKAFVQLAANQAIRTDWQPGSKVRVTGICSIAHDENHPLMGVWHPQAFQIQLRSTDDLVVIEPPPWWTSQHITIFLGVIVGGLLLGISLVTLIARRRLQEHAHQRMMAEREFTAILWERNRMAREIHDTLAQGLVATSVQLRLAKKQAASYDEPLNHHIDTAQQLVRGSLQDARNSIWNMRSQILETGDLAEALTGILRQMAEGTETKTVFEIIGRPRRLAPVLESNLLRVGQEAITNAARYAQATQIKVKMEFGEKQFRLIVTDNGHGFDPACPPQSNGGFGLMGMRERAAELKGDLIIRSAPDQGSEINFCLPLSGE